MLHLFAWFSFLFQEGGSLPGGPPHTQQPPHWYEVITGVIAIPAALIGLAYSYALIKKTRLESRKTELEILEKEKALGSTEQHHAQTTIEHEAALAALRNRTYYFLLLRFVVLELLLRVYSILTTPIQWAAGAFVFGITATHMINSVFRNFIVGGLTFGVNILTSAGYWIIFFAVGWPLFKDANRAIGIDLAEYRPKTLIKHLRALSKSSKS